MNEYEEDELARELKALAARIPVPPSALRSPNPIGARLRVVALGTLAVLFAVAIAGTLPGLRTSPVGPAAATRLSSPSATDGPVFAPPSGLPSTNPPLSFPDVNLIAGTAVGTIYRVDRGQVVGSAQVCGGEAVLAMRVSPSGRSVLVVCGGTPTGQAVVVDAVTLAVGPESQAVLSRDDVAAWAPDERSIALLQAAACAAQLPACPMHVSLWDLARGTTRVIRPDAPLTSNLRWTSAGLSVWVPQGSSEGTVIWDGQTWISYSPRLLWLADTSGNALLVEASPGSSGGRVWKRVGRDEHVLSAPGDIEYPAALDGDRALVTREQPQAAVVSYRGESVERVVPAPAACRAAQQWGRWLVCTTASSAVTVFSLDSNAFAVRAITGLASFSSLAVLPKP